MTFAPSRRTALLLPFGLAACSTIDRLFESDKKPLPGKREVLTAQRRGLATDPADTRVITLPPAVATAEWPQAGGTATHVGGHIALAGFTPAWRADIGEGGGYRRKLTATPVVAEGRVFCMDSDAVVSAFDVETGKRAWRAETQGENDRSTNVGGGLAVVGGVVFVTTGRSDTLALEAATGKVKWRKSLGSPARSAPTVSGGRVFATTIDSRLVALSAESGERDWEYQAGSTATTLLSETAPAVAEGLVVAGFGSGELAAVREETGALAWTDSLASARGRNSLVDLSAIRALPVIDRGRVCAIGVGGLLVTLDLRTGRRLWEREVGGGETPWLAGDWLFVQSSDQTLAAIGREDGKVRWVTDLPRYENEEKKKDLLFWTGPVLAGGKLILAGSNETALSVDPLTGAVLGQQPLRGAAAVAPVAAAGTLFILTDDSTLQAFR